MRTSSLKGRAFSNGCFIAVLLLILGIQTARLFYGVDVTDESYYFTNITRILQGDALFVNIWDITQTAALPYLPFYWLYSLVFGFDGLLLFGRILSLVLRMGIVVLGYFALSPRFGKRLALCVSIILLVYAPFSIYTPGYNNSSFLFCIMGSFLWLIALQQSSGFKRCVLLVLSGIAHACMVSCYPAIALAVPFIAFGQYWISRLSSCSRKRSLKDLAWYGLGALLIASALLVYVFWGATLPTALQAVKEFLSAPYAVGNDEFSRLASAIEDVSALLQRTSVLLALTLFVALSGIALVALRLGKIRPWCQRGCGVLYGLWALVVLHVIISGDRGVLSSQDAIFLLVLPLPCLLLCFVTQENRKETLIDFCVLGLPSLAITIVNSSISGGGFMQAKYALIGLFLFTLLVYIKGLLCKQTGNSFTLGGEAVCLVVVITLLSAQFLFPYRDEVPNLESTRVESGPAAGLYTTPTNASMLDEMKQDMDSVAVAGGHLLVVECYSYAYGLSTAMSPAAPSTWIVSSRLGMGTSNLYWTKLFDYYEKFQIIPDVIFLDANNRAPEFMANPKANPQGEFDLNYNIHEYLLENYQCETYRDSYSLWVKKQTDHAKETQLHAIT